MKKRINIQFLCIAFLAILITVSSIAFIFYDILKKEVIKDLKTYARLLVDTKAYEDIEETLHVSKESDLRVTLINNDGKVIYDNNTDVGVMNNHSERPEVLEAMENGSGYDVRKSDTMEKNTFYYALKVNDDIILRVAKESNSLISVYKTSVPVMVFVVILLMFLCVMLSHYLTKSIMKPIEQMANNIDDCSNISTYKELKPFLTTIQKQHEDIVKNAHMRQDFTANVSHELKTPLTSISGYSELIENGMATNEDVVRFAKEIHRNSNRLLTLINDIIRLSELDTINKDITFDRINLKDIALSCVEMLKINADKNNVRIYWEGTDAFVYANKDLIDELTYNLCDNAIRYNKENGTVIVKTVEDDDKCILSVSDTGIGIPKEHQERIFERFYRVDKSRSKLTGGTGLGLAIVKHIIAQHENVELELDSEVGKGTNMRVVFRKEI